MLLTHFLLLSWLLPVLAAILFPIIFFTHSLSIWPTLYHSQSLPFSHPISLSLAHTKRAERRVHDTQHQIRTAGVCRCGFYFFLKAALASFFSMGVPARGRSWIECFKATLHFLKRETKTQLNNELSNCKLFLMQASHYFYISDILNLK